MVVMQAHPLKRKYGIFDCGHREIVATDAVKQSARDARSAIDNSYRSQRTTDPEKQENQTQEKTISVPAEQTETNP